MGLGFGTNRTAAAAWAVGGLCAVLSTGGCQNKVYDDNKALREQNRELQARLDERNSMRPQDVPLTPPDGAKPLPDRASSTTAPAVATVPPPAAPTPPTDLGGEVTVDPVAGTTTVNFLGDALFDSGKATLKTGAKTNLEKVVAALKKQYAGKPVKVQGHSDSDPIRHSAWKSNQELSEARAKAVRDYLVQRGVPAAGVSAEGFGDAKPKSPTDKSMNRRVEIVVLTR